MVKVDTNKGCIRIADDVFTMIAGDAASNCFGVKGMALRSVSDGLVHLLKRESMGKGIYVTFGEDNTVSIEMHIVIEHGVNIPALCKSIISEVGYKVSTATGVAVKAVDVYIDSIIS